MLAGDGIGGVSVAPLRVRAGRLGRRADGRPAAVTARAGDERAVTTPWSYRLLAAFLLLLYTNAALLVPALAPFAPAQSVGLAALAVLIVERVLARGTRAEGATIRLAWPESHLLLVFLGAAAVSSFTALWTRLAVESTIELAKFVAIYLLLVNTVESWGRLRTTYAVMAVGGLFPALGTLQHLRAGELVEGDRAGWIGIFANPNDLAYSLVLLFPLVLALATVVHGWRRAALVGALALYAAAIFWSYSRGGLMGFVVVVGLSFLLWARPAWRVPGLLAGALLVALALGTFWHRAEGFGDLVADATVHERLDTIRAGLAMFADHPLLGVGIGCSVLGWPEYAPAGSLAQGWLHSHNTVVQVLGETGAAGALAYLLLVAFGLWHSHRLARRLRAAGRADLFRLVSALEVSLVGFLVCGLSGGYVLSWFPYLVLGLASAAWIVGRRWAAGEAE